MISWLSTRMLVALALVACSQVSLQAQSHSQSIQMDAGDMEGQPYTLEELGAVVVHNKQGMQVLFVMDPDMRTEAYKDVDLQAQDIILMANGKKLEAIDDLKDLMAGLAIGDQVQLGIKRNKDMQIVRFLKADPESLPKTRRMLVTADAGEDGEAKPKMSIQSAGGEERVSMLRGTGIIAREVEGHVEVAHLLPHVKDVKGLSDIQEGEFLVSLQGTKLTTLEDLEEAWQALEIGAEVTMVCSQSGQEHTRTFIKPDASDMPGGAVMIKK